MVGRALLIVLSVSITFAASPCLAQTYSMCHYDSQGRLVRAEKSNGISLSYRYDQEDSKPRSILKANRTAEGDKQTQMASGCQVRVKRSPSPIKAPSPN